MAEHLEIEQKFDVDTEFERPDRAALEDRLRGERGARVTAADPVLHHLSATYFDTADGRLADRGITLRRRTGGTDEGWHLKLPASVAAAIAAGQTASPPPDGLKARREIHAPLGAAGLAVPAELTARIAEITGDLPLAPIATLDTERTVVTLYGGDGHVVAEIADDVVTGQRLRTFATAATDAIRWREIEVEVPAAAPELLRSAADLLFAAGARPAGHGSKVGRVLGS